MFGIFYFTQYPNIPHHQISCHITLKLSKRSTQRNVFKRAVTSYIQTHKLYAQKINTRYYKLFIVLNKHKLEFYEQKIANMDKKDIIIFVQKEFAAAWAALNKKLS
jgi:RNase P protein component